MPLKHGLPITRASLNHQYQLEFVELAQKISRQFSSELMRKLGVEKAVTYLLEVQIGNLILGHNAYYHSGSRSSITYGFGARTHEEYAHNPLEEVAFGLPADFDLTPMRAAIDGGIAAAMQSDGALLLIETGVLRPTARLIL